MAPIFILLIDLGCGQGRGEPGQWHVELQDSPAKWLRGTAPQVLLAMGISLCAPAHEAA